MQDEATNSQPRPTEVKVLTNEKNTYIQKIRSESVRSCLGYWSSHGAASKLYCEASLSLEKQSMESDKVDSSY